RFLRDLLAGLPATHPPPRAMRARVVAELVPFAAHDEGACAHRPGDDAEVAGVGLDGTLARHPDVLPTVALARGEVVVAVDALCFATGTEEPEQDGDRRVDHRR